jgi:hypothetical protein
VLAEASAYGGANGPGRKTLLHLDSLAGHIRRELSLLERIDLGEAGDMPGDLVRSRARALGSLGVELQLWAEDVLACPPSAVSGT